MFIQVLTVITPILICIAVGFVWARCGRSFDMEFATGLITYIGAPCLVVVSLCSVSLNIDTLLRIAGAGFLITVAIGIMGAVGLRLSGMDYRVYLPSLMFGNIGNMGLPLCLFAFGEKGLAIGIVYFTVLSVLHFTVGIYIVQGTSCGSIRNLFKNPIVISIFVAVGLLASGVKLPTYVFNALKILGDITIPLMLLMLGVALNRLTITHFFRSFAFGGARIAMGFCVGLAVVRLLKLDHGAGGVVLIQSSTPVAVFNYLFALKYDREPGEVAGMVVSSTVLSFLFLPPLLMFVL